MCGYRQPSERARSEEIGIAVANPEAGERFEEYVRVAIARSKRVHNPAELIRATKMNRNTLYELFNGETEHPGSRTMDRIASALDVPVADLWAVWQGRELPPDTMEEALRRHTSAMAQQTRLLGELVGFIRSSALAILTAGGDAEQIRTALVAIGAAREDQAEGPEGSPPAEPTSFAPQDRSDEGTRPRSLRPQPDR